MVNITINGNKLSESFREIKDILTSFINRGGFGSNSEEAKWAAAAMAVYSASKNIAKSNYNFIKPQIIKKVEGIMIHSTGNPGMEGHSFIDRYLSCYYPNNEVNKCAHVVVDLDGSVYQLLPWNYRASHSEGSYENYISVVLCEPVLVSNKDTRTNIDKVYNSGVELCAVLCNLFNLDPSGKNITGGYNVLLGHNEILGIYKKSDKVRNDPEDYWEPMGEDYSMNSFRNDVIRKMAEYRDTNLNNSVKLLSIISDI